MLGAAEFSGGRPKGPEQRMFSRSQHRWCPATLTLSSSSGDKDRSSNFFPRCPACARRVTFAVETRARLRRFAAKARLRSTHATTELQQTHRREVHRRRLYLQRILHCPLKATIPRVARCDEQPGGWHGRSVKLNEVQNERTDCRVWRRVTGMIFVGVGDARGRKEGRRILVASGHPARDCRLPRSKIS